MGLLRGADDPVQLLRCLLLLAGSRGQPAQALPALLGHLLGEVAHLRALGLLRLLSGLLHLLQLVRRRRDPLALAREHAPHGILPQLLRCCGHFVRSSEGDVRTRQRHLAGVERLGFLRHVPQDAVQAPELALHALDFEDALDLLARDARLTENARGFPARDARLHHLRHRQHGIVHFPGVLGEDVGCGLGTLLALCRFAQTEDFQRLRTQEVEGIGCGTEDFPDSAHAGSEGLLKLAPGELAQALPDLRPLPGDGGFERLQTTGQCLGRNRQQRTQSLHRPRRQHVRGDAHAGAQHGLPRRRQTLTDEGFRLRFRRLRDLDRGGLGEVEQLVQFRVLRVVAVLRLDRLRGRLPALGNVEEVVQFRSRVHYRTFCKERRPYFCTSAATACATASLD